MSEHLPDRTRARSFDRVAEQYDRARPSYPEEAVAWMLGPEPARVLELAAGTGKLTQRLVDAGHSVTATDPSPQMVQKLRERVPTARPALAIAEQMPLARGSVDGIVAAQAFHWFDQQRVLTEAARVLRPNGVLALVWNFRDERIPWVRRLGTIIGDHNREVDPTRAIDDSGLFRHVESARFRFWQPLTQDSLRDLVASRSNVAVLSDLDRQRVLRQVDDLYAEYGRGADGMLLPYVTFAYRATVLPRREPDPEPPTTVGPDDIDTDSLLIDFR